MEKDEVDVGLAKVVARDQRLFGSIDETKVYDFNAGPRNLPSNLVHEAG